MWRINLDKMPRHLPWKKTLPGPALRVKFEAGELLWFLLPFFIGRAAIMGEITPFAFIFWSHVMRLRPEKKVPVTGAIFSGWATLKPGLFPPWFLPAAMLLWLMLDFLGRKIFKKKLSLSFLLPLVILVLRLPWLYRYHFTIYEAFIAGLEVALAVLLPPLLQPFFEEMGIKESRPSPEAITGALLLLSLVFWGMKGLVLPGGIELINVTSFLLILAGAYFRGPVFGAIAGVILGWCLSLGDPSMFPYSGALGLAGLTAGLLSPHRRFWTAAGYILVLRFLSYYGAEGGFTLTRPGEELFIAALFLLIPPVIWEKIKTPAIFWPFRVQDEEKLRFIMASRLKDFADVFKELAITFRPAEQGGDMGSKNDPSPLVDYFCRKVCNSCAFYERCWQGDLYNHYRRVLVMLSAVEENGKFSEKLIPVKLRKYCPRQREIVKAVSNMREIYRINCYWQEKIYESRALVSAQLEGISYIMHDLAQELKLETGEKQKNNNGIIRFSVELGVAQVARDGEVVTGDSYAVFPLKDGKQAIILSDGMGSGREAHLASHSTVKLMEHLLGAGFRQEVVISTINTLLRLGYPGERYATLDLVFLDLKTGEGEVYKLGAPPSFLKKGEHIKVIGSASLPVGILEEISPERESFKLSAGGLLVMITDGLLDTRQGNEENWLIKALQEIPHDHPQIIADRLLEEACYRWPRGVQDDLTVLVGRLKPLFGK